MPRFKPLKYREVVKILRNLGSNLEFRDKTLASIIRQSGFSKKEFYNALKK